MERKEFDHEILLLQGGGALGAYQAAQFKPSERTGEGHPVCEQDSLADETF